MNMFLKRKDPEASYSDKQIMDKWYTVIDLKKNSTNVTIKT